MKKLFTLLAVSLSFIFANAQQNYKIPVMVLLQYAENNFKDILGEKLPDDPSVSDYILYRPKEKLEIGTEQIYVNKKDNSGLYVCFVPLTDSSQILKDVLEYVNMKAKNGDYSGEDIDKGNGKNVTTVKNKAGKTVLEIETSYVNDDSSENDYFALFIHGKDMK